MDEKFGSIYRYRNYEAAIAELKSGILRYVSIENNNDPTDGYFELVFDADEIVWKNFFKNYIKSILIFWIDTLDYKNNRLIKPQINSFYFLEYKKYINEIYYKFSNQKFYLKFIDLLTYKEISEEELKPFLNLIHMNILSILKDVLKDEEFLYVRYINVDNRINESINLCLERLEELNFNTIKTLWQEVDKVNRNFYSRMEFQLIDDNKKIYKENMMNMQINFINLFMSQLKISLHPNIYVICFTKEHGNMSMWDRYANGSKGVCFEYETKIKENNIELNNKFKDTSPLKKVKYRDSVNRLNFFKNFSGLNRKRLNENWTSIDGKTSKLFEFYTEMDYLKEYKETFEKLSTIKGINWKYEREYRIYQTDHWKAPAEYYETSKLEKQFLKGVILGENMPIKNRINMISLIQKKINDGDLEKVTIYTTKHKIGTYDLEKIKLVTLTKNETTN